MGAVTACPIVCQNLDISQSFIYTDIKDCFGLKICITSITGQNWQFFVPRNLEIWWMILENNRALLQTFQIQQWIETGVTVSKRSTRVNITNFLSPVTLKFDGWP